MENNVISFLVVNVDEIEMGNVEMYSFLGRSASKIIVNKKGTGGRYEK